MSTFCWPPPKTGAAGELATSGDPVDVSAAAPPNIGQVLTGISSTAAEWSGPGLRYDPSIKFWTATSGGLASIEPNTWGFVDQWTGAPLPTQITVTIVSDLTAPPASSKFGLYVGANVTLPVVVQLIGTSQIQGADGTLAPTATIFPNAYYEWILYHEAGVAVWGLVAITAGVARSISVAGAAPLALPTSAPAVGQSLVATSPTTLVWSGWSVASNINPRHWWRADTNINTAGVVDSLTDLGRAGTTKNFTASGSDRASLATDANGKTYLNFSNHRYVAGVAADWSLLNNGNKWTICAVISKASAPATGNYCLLATSNWGSGSPGIMIIQGAGNNVAGGPTPVYGWSTGITGSGAPTCEASAASTIAPTGVLILVLVHNGYRLRQGLSGMSAYDNQGGGENDPMGRTRCVAMELWENGRRICEGFSSVQPYTAGAPHGALTLGKAADSAIPITAGVYEILIENRALTTWDVEQYTRDAAVRYSVTL